MKESARLIPRKEFLKRASWAAASFFLSGGNLASLARKSSQSSRPAERLPLIELGRTGIRVTPLGFGASRTMDSMVLKAALQEGINFVDTGRSYFRGQNEVMVGKAVASIRKDIIIQTRLRVPLTETALTSSEEMENALKEMDASLLASLKALQTDYLDILLIHGAASPRVIHHEAILEFFERGKKKGVIRACGFSTHTHQVELLQAANQKLFYDIIMVPYNHKGAYVHMNTGRANHWDQQALEAELDRARKNGLGLIAMKTCSGGPYSAGPDSKPSYVEALRWILGRCRVHTMAVAMANFSQIEENVGALL